MVKRRGKNTGLAALGVGIGLAVLFGLIAGTAKAGQIESLGLAPNNMDASIDQQVKAALAKIKQLYGDNFAKQIEQILRWETAHFSSGGWKQTNAAGMEATDNIFPFGWNSLVEFILDYGAELNLEPEDFKIKEMQENNGSGAPEKFIVWPNAYSFILFLAWFIDNKRQGRAGYWYSLNEEAAQRYENKIAGVNTPYVDSLQ